MALAFQGTTNQAFACKTDDTFFRDSKISIRFKDLVAHSLNCIIDLCNIEPIDNEHTFTGISQMPLLSDTGICIVLFFL